MTILEVLIFPPDICGNRLNISFESNFELTQLRSNSFWFEYPSLKGSEIDRIDGYNLALGVLISHLSKLSHPVTVRLLEEIPRNISDFWGIYHNSGHVTVEFPNKGEQKQTVLSDYSNRTKKPSLGSKPGIFFGGGKDSLAITGMMMELGFPITFITFSNPRSGKIEDYEERRKLHTLMAVADDYGIQVVTVRSNLGLQSRNPIHTEVYTAGVLPVLRKYGLDSLSISYELCHYYTSIGGLKCRIPKFRNSRPELNLSLIHI